MRDLLCAGELNVDLVLTGVKQPPVFGLEIMAEDYVQCLGSSTVICACVAAKMGLDTAFFGKLGTDPLGDVAFQGLVRNRVDAALVERSPKYRTGLTVSVSSDRDRAMITCFGDTIDCFDALDVPLAAANARHLHAGSYFFQTKVRKNLHILFQQAKGMGMTTSLDAGWDEQGRWGAGLKDILPATDFFFPNEREACAVAGTDDPREAAIRIAAMGTTAVVKMGDQGALLCLKGAREVRAFGPVKARVTDTTGAGDSFNGGFLYAFLKGMPMEACMAYANAAGAVSVTRPGGTLKCPTLEEVERAIMTGRAEDS